MIERIVAGRGTGKTQKLIEAARKVNGIIVCRDCDRMMDKLRRLGVVGLDVMSYDIFLNGEIDTTRKYFIDELDKMIEELAENSVAGYTYCIE